MGNERRGKPQDCIRLERFAMKISKLSTDGAVETINEICDGIKKFIKNNPDAAKDLLQLLKDEVLDPLSSDDFFGTEGWEHAFGIE